MDISSMFRPVTMDISSMFRPVSMDISSMFRPALNRITSSMASTASYGFTRVLSFTGSFNDQTSLLADDPPSASPSQAQEPAAPTTTGSSGPLDIEAAALEDTRDGGDGGLQADEPKRVSKSVQTVCLFAASASLVLFVNLPSKHEASAAVHSALYSVNLAFICLSLFTSLGLSMFSIVARSGNPAVARVQKRAMVMAVAFVLVSFTLRMCMMLPAASLESVWFFFFLLAGAAALYLSLAWKLGDGRPQIPPNIPVVEAGGTADERV